MVYKLLLIFYERKMTHMSRKVIDVSKWNGNVDWATVKNYVDGVILRVGVRGYGKEGYLQTDSSFKKNADACVKYGIPFGVYWFAQEITDYESVEAARYIHNLVKGYKLSYPIYYDVEYSSAPNHTGRADNLDQYTRTRCTVSFCEEIERLGYEAGVYAIPWWFYNKLEFNKIKIYNIWVAQWNEDNGMMGTRPDMPFDMWQYTSKGNIPGFNGDVDVNLDLSALISNSNISTPSDTIIDVIPNTKKSVEEVAKEVINGKWGNGNARKTALTKAGYDYAEIQSKVQELLYGKQTIVNVKYKPGDQVKLTSDATFIDGTKIAPWVKFKKLYIRSDEFKDESYVVSTLKTGAITGVVHKKYLVKA